MTDAVPPQRPALAPGGWVCSFTGRGDSMPDAQALAVRDLLMDAEGLHLGDSPGADKQAYALAVSLGIDISVHRERDDGGDRNHDIVDNGAHLIAAPPTTTELAESGTWDTIRYARQVGRPITIIWPDGSASYEPAPPDGVGSNPPAALVPSGYGSGIVTLPECPTAGTVIRVSVPHARTPGPVTMRCVGLDHLFKQDGPRETTLTLAGQSLHLHYEPYQGEENPAQYGGIWHAVDARQVGQAIVTSRPDGSITFEPAPRAAVAELDRIRHAYGTTSHEVEQILGKALKYPAYGPDMFPPGVEPDVCVGDHVPQSLAQEAADRIAHLRGLLDMQWKRSGEATARWRAEAPKERELIRPDLGTLLAWLMADADTVRAQRNEAIALLSYVLHLRMYGERAPGGNETWNQFDRDADQFMRGPAAVAWARAVAGQPERGGEPLG